MNAAALRAALAAALDALDAPDPEPVEVEPVADIIEAQTDADRDRIAAEAEADAVRIAAEAEAEVKVIEAEAAAEVDVIEAEGEAAADVIEAADDATDDDDEPEVLDCPDDLDLGDLGGIADELVDMIEDGADVLDGPADDAPLDIEDIAPAATHWYTRKRRFRSR